MRIMDINRSRVATAMVRGYFHSFFSGQIDALSPDKKKLEPREYKQLLANNFDNLSSHFVSVLFPVLIRLNYDDFDQVTTDMKRRLLRSCSCAMLVGQRHYMTWLLQNIRKTFMLYWKVIC